MSKITADEALDHIAKLAEFAYENGFHEIGYDAVQVVRDELTRLRAGYRFANHRVPKPTGAEDNARLNAAIRESLEKCAGGTTTIPSGVTDAKNWTADEIIAAAEKLKALPKPLPPHPLETGDTIVMFACRAPDGKGTRVDFLYQMGLRAYVDIPFGDRVEVMGLPLEQFLERVALEELNPERDGPDVARAGLVAWVNQEAKGKSGRGTVINRVSLAVRLDAGKKPVFAFTAKEVLRVGERPGVIPPTLPGTREAKEAIIKAEAEKLMGVNSPLGMTQGCPLGTHRARAAALLASQGVPPLFDHDHKAAVSVTVLDDPEADPTPFLIHGDPSAPKPEGVLHAEVGHVETDPKVIGKDIADAALSGEFDSPRRGTRRWCPVDGSTDLNDPRNWK
jgi:hypothetical protein